MNELKYRDGVAYEWGESTQTEAEFKEQLNKNVIDFIVATGSLPFFVDDNNKPEQSVIDEALATYEKLNGSVSFTIPAKYARKTSGEGVDELIALVDDGVRLGTVSIAPNVDGTEATISIPNQVYAGLTDDEKSQITALAEAYAIK